MEMEREIEISIKDIFKILKHGLWIIITTGLVFAIAAFGFSNFFIQKTYVSTIKLYVDTTKAQNVYTNDLTNHNLATSLVDTYIEMLQTVNFYEDMAENLDNKYTAADISTMVKFENDSDTEVFTATVVAKSPTEAKVVADSVADVAPGIISAIKSNAALRIVADGTIPVAPSSPNVSKNTVLAFVAGLVLSLIFVFVREALDNKIKYDEDVTELMGLPVLSAIPDFSETTLQASEIFTSEQKDSVKEDK